MRNGGGQDQKWSHLDSSLRGGGQVRQELPLPGPLGASAAMVFVGCEVREKGYLWGRWVGGSISESPSGMAHTISDVVWDGATHPRVVCRSIFDKQEARLEYATFTHASGSVLTDEKQRLLTREREEYPPFISYAGSPCLLKLNSLLTIALYYLLKH